MIQVMKKKIVHLSLVASMALVPTVALSASGNGMMEGSSESTSALIEPANVEKQLQRINSGINIVRINSDILYSMPVSADSQWVDIAVGPITEQNTKIISNKIVQNDPYLATVALSNVYLGQSVTLGVSPLTKRMFHLMLTIYDNNQLPDLNTVPDISNIETFTNFTNGAEGQLIKVEAKTSTLYKNVEEATIALASDENQEIINEAKENFKSSEEVFLELKSEVGKIEAWLDDDNNAQSPNRKAQEEKLAVKEKELDDAEAKNDEMEEIYFKSLEDAAADIENNFDESKVKLARKLEKLLDVVDNNAFGAVSMFTSASAHLIKNGIGTIQQELQAIDKAKANYARKASTPEQARQVIAFFDARYEMLKNNAIYAIPNIGIGLYAAGVQSSFAGKLQTLVHAVVEAGDAAEEARQKAAEAQKAAQAENPEA